MKISKPELAGWAGVILIQSATLPVTIGNILGLSHSLPPLSMVLLVWAGLILFLYRAIVNKDTIYIVSNAVGLLLNTILLAIIVFPHA